MRENSNGLSAGHLYLSAGEVAVLLRISKRAVYVRHQRRKLPGARKVGDRLLFHRPTLLAWIESCDVPPVEV